jgi:iron complex outermembrane receptor protein
LNKKIVLKQSVIAVALTLATTQFATAQTAVAGQQAVTQVTVTGSNLKRADKEGTSAVQVITAKEIEASGAGTVSDLMRLVPAIGTDSARDLTSGSGFSSGVATASLRGLSSTSTLILLNGRRMAYSAYADPNNGKSTLYDLNSIPVSALERVEVLKDGASAIYGSDAIGGVINFITKSNYDGAVLHGAYGANDKNKFTRKNASLIWGKGDVQTDGYSLFITADLTKRGRVAIKEVTDINWDQYVTLNGRFRSNYSSSVSGFPEYFRESAPNSKAFGVTQANINTRVKWNLGCDPSERITGGVKDGLLSTSVLIGQTFCNYDVDQFTEAQSAGTDGSLLSRAEFKLGQNAVAYAEIAYTETKRDYTAAPITLGQTAVTNFSAAGVVPSFQAILPIGHPDNPFTDARASVGYRFVNKRGGRAVTDKNTRVLVGAKGTNFGFDWDTGLLWNQSKNMTNSYDRLFLPTLNKLLTGTSLAQLAADPTITRDTIQNGKSEIFQVDLKGTTTIGQLPGGPVQLVVGAESRQEKILIVPDAVLAAGNIYGLSNTRIDGQRKVNAAFFETGLFLTKALEVDVAGRYDKFEGLDGKFVPKVASKFTLSDMVTLRGTYQRGFRAPALQQVTPGGAQFFLQGVIDLKRCETDNVTPKPGATATDCSKSIAGTGGYNPDLKAETSKQHSMGIIFQPVSWFDATFDYFKIRKEGQVILGTASDALKYEDRDPSNVLRDPNPVNWVTLNGVPVPNTGPLLMVKTPWQNQGGNEISGIDMSFKLRNNLGAWGKLNTSMDATYTKSYIIQQFPGDTENNTAGGRAGIWDWQLSSGYDAPKWKSSLSTSWTYDVHTVNASVNYIGPVSLLRVVDGKTTYAQPFCYYGTKKATDAAPDRSTAVPLFEAYTPDCNVSAWTTFGAGYSYSGIKNVKLSLNIQNIFDAKAPYDPNTVTDGYNSGLHNNTGRYFRFSMDYTFK